MNSIQRLLLPCLALFLAPAIASARGELVIDLGRGPVTLHVPDSYDGETPAPLALLLHGFGASGAVQEAYFQLLPEMEERGFLYMYPDGSSNPQGSRFWNATDACCDFFDSGIDDSAYLRALIEEVREQLFVDARRIYVLGHSNGGFMAYRMACDHSEVIAGAVSLAGATWEDLADCTASEPVDVLQIHGTADSTILFGGGNLLGVPYPGAQGTAERWATLDGCDLVPDTSAGNINVVADIPGMETTITRWVDGCAPGGSAELWTIPGGVHVPNLSNPFPRLVVDWLLEHPRPGLGTSYCTSTPNSTGQAAIISAAGTLSVAANDLVLRAGPVPPAQVGLFYYGPEMVVAPFGNGTRCVGAGSLGLFRLPPRSATAGGELIEQLDLAAQPPGPGQILPGSTWNVQAWFRDPAAGGAFFDLSDAVSLTFGS